MDGAELPVAALDEAGAGGVVEVLRSALPAAGEALQRQQHA